MARTALLLALLLFAACLLLPQQAPPDAPPTFRGESTLALVPFSAIRGEYFALDLKAEDILLFEDGKPREFTIFEGPGTGRRPPLELVLLFDTTTFPPPESKIKVENTYWDREATYAFTKDWSDKESRAVLEKNGADVRVAVYRPGLSDGRRIAVPAETGCGIRRPGSRDHTERGAFAVRGRIRSAAVRTTEAAQAGSPAEG
jgi:hypothetical protein